MARNYLIIGNGAAGTTAAESIRKQDGEAAITILTEEDTPFYSRIRLISYLVGDMKDEDLIIRKDPWYAEHRIDLRLNTRIVEADPDRRLVTAADGRTFPYDRLLIATGSRSFIPPIKGAEKRGVFTLRDIRDARMILSHAREIENVLLIGGGLLGLEAGNSLLKMGKRIMVVEVLPRLLPRQLDPKGAERLQRIMEGMGFSFRIGAATREIRGTDRVENVLLDSGESLRAELVLISAGVRPNMELARYFGLETDKGIVVDDHLRTSREDVYAAGDVAQFKGIPYGIWPAAVEQGRVAGINMAGGDLGYPGTVMANMLKVVEIDLASAGNIDADNQHEAVLMEDEKSYRKLVLEDDRIIGSILLGDTRGFNKITRAISEGLDISGIRDRIWSELAGPT